MDSEQEREEEPDYEDIESYLVSNPDVDPEFIAIIKRLHDCHVKKETKLDMAIQKHQATISQGEEKAKSLEEVIAKGNDKISQLNKDIDHLKREIDASHGREQDLHETGESLRSQVKKLEDIIRKKKAEEAEMDAELGITPAAREDFNQEKERLNWEITILTETNNNLVKQLEAFIETRKECSSKIKESDQLIEEKDETIEMLEKESSHLSDVNASLEEEIENATKQLFDTQNQLLELKNVLRNTDQRVILLQEKNKELENKIKAYKYDVAQAEGNTYFSQAKFQLLAIEYKRLQIVLETQEEEMKALKKSLLSAVNIQESASKKLFAAEVTVNKAVEDKEKYRMQVITKDQLIAEKQAAIDVVKRDVANLTRQKAIMNKNVNKAFEAVKDAKQKLKSQIYMTVRLEAEKDGLNKEINEQIRLQSMMINEKDRIMKDFSALKNKYEENAQELKLKQIAIFELKRDDVEKNAKIRVLTTTADLLRTERISFANKLTEAKDELIDLRNKMSVISHQMEQLKEDVNVKERLIVKEEMNAKRVAADRDGIAQEFRKANERLHHTGKELRKKDKEILKLANTIGSLQIKNSGSKKEVTKLKRDMALLASQLDRRTAEIGLLYEKLSLSATLFRQGECQYGQRLDDIRILKLEIKKLRYEKTILTRSFSNMSDLRHEIFCLNRDLTKERQRVQALEEELENPVNYHRWRLLEGTDPDKKELIDKVHILQKKLIDQGDEMAHQKVAMGEVQERCNKLKAYMEKMPGVEAAKELEKVRRALKEKTCQNKVLVAELSALEAEVAQYKFRLEQLQKELNDFKKKYYQQKLKDDAAKIQMNDEINKQLFPIAREGVCKQEL